jgi:hypothetical protein
MIRADGALARTASIIALHAGTCVVMAATVNTVDDELVGARWCIKRVGPALRGVGGQPDIVAADGDRDQVGVRADRVDLRGHRTPGRLLWPAGDVVGGGAAAGDVNSLA